MDPDFFDKLENFMQTNFNKKEPRECPECAKCNDDSIPKYFASLGSLKEHLLEHYRVKYYLENSRHNKYQMQSQPSSSKRQCTFNEKMAPWHDDYEPVDASRLEKYMDRDIFADYLECVEDEREAKREEKRRREEKMLKVKSMVERDRERRQKEFDKKVKSNSDLFNEDTDSLEDERDAKREERRKREAKGMTSKSKNNDKSLEDTPTPAETLKKRKRVATDDVQKSNAEPKKHKPLNEIIEQIDLTKLDLNLEDLSDDGGHIPSGNLTVLNIRQNNYRFCPMCSKDKIPANELPEHVKKCLATSSKIYNSFISMKG